MPLRLERGLPGFTKLAFGVKATDRERRGCLPGVDDRKAGVCCRSPEAEDLCHLARHACQDSNPWQFDRPRRIWKISEATNSASEESFAQPTVSVSWGLPTVRFCIPFAAMGSEREAMRLPSDRKRSSRTVIGCVPGCGR